MDKIPQTDIPMVGKDAKHQELSFIAGENAKWVSLIGK